MRRAVRLGACDVLHPQAGRLQHRGPARRQGRGARAGRRVDRGAHALPRHGRLRALHAGARVHAALRGAGRRGPLHHGGARHQQGPLAHRDAGGQHARAAAGALAGGDRAGLRHQPAVALRAGRAGGHRPGRRPDAFRHAGQLVRGRPAVPAAHGTSGGGRRGGAGRGAGVDPAGGRSRPRLLRRDGSGRGRNARDPRRHLGAHAPSGFRALSLRAGGLAPVARHRPPARARPRGQRRLLPGRHADHLPLRALRPGRPLHAVLPDPGADAGGGHCLPQHRLPRAVRSRGPRRGARPAGPSRAPSTCW